MTKIGLHVIINKFNNYFESNQMTDVFNTLEEAKNKLIIYLCNNIKHLNIDFPLDLIDFEYIWFNQQYVNCNAFNYKIFSDNNWNEPWDLQDIYSDVINFMINEESQNPPDFSQIFGEPSPDETVDDRFLTEPTGEMLEMENKLKEIISQAKSIDNDGQVKECHCQKCLDGIAHRLDTFPIPE